MDEQNGAVLFELHLVFARVDVRLFGQLAVLDQHPLSVAVRLDQVGQLLLVVLGPQTSPADDAVRQWIRVDLAVQLSV